MATYDHAHYDQDAFTSFDWNHVDGSKPTYRIGTSDRPIGGATGAADGFTVLNSTNGNVFVAASGVWTDGGNGTFSTAVFDDWLLS